MPSRPADNLLDFTLLPFAEFPEFAPFTTEFILPTVKMPVTPQQLLTITEYTGATDIEVFIELIGDLREQYEWTNEDAASAAKQRLRGEAQEFVRSKRKMQVLYPIWTDDDGVTGLSTDLKIRFKPTVTNIAAADAIQKLAQRSDESVNAFYDRVIGAIDLKNSQYTEQEKAAAAYLAHFRRELFLFFGGGLRPEIRSKTLGAPVPPVDADALLAAAKSVEADIARNRKHVSMVTVGAAAAATGNENQANVSALYEAHDAEEDEMNSVMKKVAALEVQLDALRKGAARNVTCFNCGGKGHLATTCPSEKRPPGSGQRGGRGARRRGRGGRGGSGGGGRGGYNSRGRGAGTSGGGRTQPPPAGRWSGGGGGDRRGGGGRGRSNNWRRNNTWEVSNDDNEYYVEEEDYDNQGNE